MYYSCNKYIAITEREHLYMWEWRDYKWWLLIRLLWVSIRTGSNLGLTFPKLIERGWKGEHVCICVPIDSCVEGLWDKTVVWQLGFMQFLMHYPVKFQRKLLVPRLVADWLPMGLSHNCVVQLQNSTDFICHNSTKQLLNY